LKTAQSRLCFTKCH